MCFPDERLFFSLNNHCVTKQEFGINVCVAIIGIFIILINLLAFVTLIKHTDMQEPTNYFIANLAAADSVLGIFVIYDVLYNILHFKNYIECVLRMGLYISVNIASVFNLTILTFDRYIKVTHPYIYHQIFTPRKVKIAEAVIWIVSIVCGLLPFFGWSTLDILKVCIFVGIMSKSYLLFVLSMFSVPSFVITIVYVKFIMLAARHRAAIRSQLASVSPGNRRERKAWKSFKTAFMIVGAYFICWGPVGLFMFIVIVSDIGKSMKTPSENQVFVYLLGIGVFNSILNPIIYATKIGVFRRKLHKMFCVSQIQEIKRVSVRSLSNAFRSSIGASVPRKSNVSGLSVDASTSFRMETRVTDICSDQDVAYKETDRQLDIIKEQPVLTDKESIAEAEL